MTTRQEYLDACKDKADWVRAAFKPLVRYVRDRRNNPVGVVISFRLGNRICYGWSKCHTPADRFDRDVGLVKAYQKATDDVNRSEYLDEIPHSVRPYLYGMWDRARRFYKVAV